MNSLRYTSLFLITLIVSCSNPGSRTTQQGIEGKDVPYVIEGNAQGTTYTIKYFGDNRINKSSVDSLLRVIDLSMSTWVKESMISRFNAGQTVVVDRHFQRNLLASFFWNKRTDGAFNPLVKPLMSYWGFGESARQADQIDSKEVEAILPLLNMDSLRYLADKREVNIPGLSLLSTIPRKVELQALIEGMQLDFNAIAQGYSVDEIGALLTSKGSPSYLIELGGEMLARGKKPDGKSWTVGIDRPEENLDQRKLQAKLSLENGAIATSGNYRKFKEIDGVKYHHTLDPNTGYPARHNVLSATVVASECATADALATSLMVMGLEKGKAFLDTNDLNVKVFLIYSDTIDGSYKYYFTEGFEDEIEVLN